MRREPLFVQENGSRTLPKKLSVCRLPLVADGLVFTSEPGILIVRSVHSGMEVQPEERYHLKTERPAEIHWNSDLFWN
jgi:hypothetical protein